MKIKLIFLLFLVPVFVNAQSKKSIDNQSIEDKVDKIYIENSVIIKSIKLLMNNDLEKYYKLVLFNGTNKQIVAVEVGIDFSERHIGVLSTDCFLFKKVKISINSKKTKQCYLYHINSSCPYEPKLELETVVFSDGSFKSYAALASAADEINEKEEIRKRLMKQSGH